MLLRTLSAGGAGAEQGGQGGRVAGSLHREGIDLCLPLRRTSFWSLNCDHLGIGASRYLGRGARSGCERN